MAAESDQNWFVFRSKSVIAIDVNDDVCVTGRTIVQLD